METAVVRHCLQLGWVLVDQTGHSDSLPESTRVSEERKGGASEMGKCLGKTVHGRLLGPKDIILDMEAATCMFAW